jgi:hypothetical protein
MAVIHHHYDADGEEVDVSELSTIDVVKVSAVAEPANNTPFLLLKSAAQPATPTKENDVKTKTRKKAVKAAEKAINQALFGGDGHAEKNTNTGGPGVTGQAGTDVGATQSAEADAICEQVTESSSHELQAAKGVYRDPNASPEAKRIALTIMKGAVQDSLKGDVYPDRPPGYDANDLSAVQKAEADFNAATDPIEKEEAGKKLTLERLRRLHEQHKPQSAAVKAINNDPQIEALKKQLEDHPELPADIKSQIGLLVTKSQLEKSFASDSQEATNTQIREEQIRITANPQSASGGASGVAGGVQSVSGTVTHPQLASTGVREPEPAAILGQRELELAEVQKETKSGSITDREVDLRNQITKLRLQLTHA